jgi:hypothetical protein
VASYWVGNRVIISWLGSFPFFGAIATQRKNDSKRDGEGNSEENVIRKKT